MDSVENIATAFDPPATLGGMVGDLKGRTLRGGVVVLVVQGVTFVLRTGSTIILARILTPDDFGLVAMVTVVIGFFGLFKDAGLSMATVQRETITHEQISTLFWVNIAIGLVLTTLSILTARFLVAFYREPRLVGITIALASMFLFTALGVQHQALLQRKMRFVALGVIQIVALAVSITVGICMGLAGYGYWALVGMTVGFPAANAAALWVASPWVPGLPRRRCGVGSMLHFGGTVTFNGLVVYLAYNADKLLLGRYGGTEILGLYSRAQALINLPMEQLNSAIGSVALPTLSRLQSDSARLKRYFLQGYSLVLSATIPITLTSVIFADELILSLLGPKWIGAVPTFRLLAPGALALALINPFGWLLFATGQTGRSLRMALLIAPLAILACLIGLRYGAIGVATGYSGVMILLVVPLILWAKRGSSITGADVMHAVRKPCLAGVLAGLTGEVCKWTMGDMMPIKWRLLFGLCITLGVYVWLLLFAMGQKQYYLDLVRHLNPRSDR
jgi:O-antigen/teichoic acid export membrane protein